MDTSYIIIIILYLLTYNVSICNYSCMTVLLLIILVIIVILFSSILFEDADTDKSGSITFEELYAELSKYPGVIKNLTFRYQ